MRIALRASLLTMTFLAALSAPATALEIFGNTGLGNAGRQLGSEPLTQYNQLAQGFTMGSTAYDLSAVDLGLNFGATVPTSSQIIVSLFSDNGSDLPGSSIGTFNTASPTPTFTASGFQAYRFNYTGTTTLTTGTKYWIVVENVPASSPVFDWWYASGNPSDDPAAQNSSGVTFLGTRGTINGDASSWTRNLTTNFSNLRYNVVVVPEPSTYALGIAGTLVMGTVARRRGRKTASA
jgi:hypothetical protein